MDEKQLPCAWSLRPPYPSSFACILARARHLVRYQTSRGTILCLPYPSSSLCNIKSLSSFSFHNSAHNGYISKFPGRRRHVFPTDLLIYPSSLSYLNPTRQTILQRSSPTTPATIYSLACRAFTFTPFPSLKLQLIFLHPSYLRSSPHRHPLSQLIHRYIDFKV